MTTSKGLTKVIDEMGLAMITKDIELEMHRKEIEKMRKKIESIEQYIAMYEDFFNYEQLLKQKGGNSDGDFDTSRDFLKE